MWSFLKDREVRRNLRRAPVLFIQPAESKTLLLYIRRLVLEFKNNLKQFGDDDCDCLIWSR